MYVCGCFFGWVVDKWRADNGIYADILLCLFLFPVVGGEMGQSRSNVEGMGNNTPRSALPFRLFFFFFFFPFFLARFQLLDAVGCWARAEGV